MAADKPRDLSPEGLAREKANYEAFLALKKVTPEKLFDVIKSTVMDLGTTELMGLALTKPKSLADLSPAVRAAFEKAAAELNK